MSGPTPQAIGYDHISRANHWIIAIGMIGMIAFGIYLEEFVPRGPEKGQLIGLHKAIGVLILIFGLWRVGYRLVQGFLEEAGQMPKWQASFAKFVHWLLLAGVIVMPLSGLLGSYFGARAVEVFGLFSIPAGPDVKTINEFAYGIHGAYAKVMILAVLLHVVGALKHHFIDRDATLARMVRPTR